MAAAAIIAGLEMANAYGPTVITLVKRIFDRTKSTTVPVATLATVIVDLDQGDANFKDSMAADATWFASKGLTLPGDPTTAQPPTEVPVKP